MARVQEVTGRLNITFGPQHRQWCPTSLYNYVWLRGWIGVEQLKEHLPEIKESFQKQYFAIIEWRDDVKKYKAVMDLDPDVENQTKDVLQQWLSFTQFLVAVEAAEEQLDQMTEDD